jgi:hypothetical protein
VAGPAYTLRLPTRLPLLWRVMVLSLTLGALAARALAWLEGADFSSVPTLVIFAVAVPSVMWTYLGLPAQAGEAGLRLFDTWGFRRRVSWEDVRSVSLRRWPSMVFAPALRVELTDGRVRWLPRETHGLAELHALAQRRVGPEHPLVRALETPLHRL